MALVNVSDVFEVLGDLQHASSGMANKANSSVVLAQLQISFLWENDTWGLSQFGWPLSYLRSC